MRLGWRSCRLPPVRLVFPGAEQKRPAARPDCGLSAAGATKPGSAYASFTKREQNSRLQLLFQAEACSTSAAMRQQTFGIAYSSGRNRLCFSAPAFIRYPVEKLSQKGT